MMRFSWFLFVFTVSWLLVPSSAWGERPNIVLIMADDLGFEALSLGGSESCKSPNLDRLASEGIQFTNCFSNPLCTPSRVKLMTG
ncbi:MAG: sulfatase-like hydrolase/transferase, partial [Planctomycetota bacterium]